MRRGLRALLPVAAVVGVLLIPAAPAWASRQINVQPPAPCASGQIMVGGTFTLTKVSSSSQQISIQTDLDSTPQGPDTFSNGTATYIETFDGMFQTATATVSSAWSGSFTLAPTCKTASPANLTAASSQPGTPPSIAVTISNPNDIMITYTVNAGSLGTKADQKVQANGSLEVDFAAACGQSYQVTAAGNDKTQRTVTATVVACPAVPVPPTSAAPPTKAKASASPSPSPSATATSDPMMAALPQTEGPSPSDSSSPAAAALPSTNHSGFFTSGHIMWLGAFAVLFGAIALGWALVSGRRHRREPEPA